MLPLIILFVALIILGPLIIGLTMLRGRRRKLGMAILCGYVFVIIHGLIYRQTPHGHIIRFIRGEGYAKQQVDDHAENLRNSPSLERIQKWALETTKKFRSGEITSAGIAGGWDTGSPLIPDSEIPPFVRDLWKPSDPPEVFISGNAIVIAWNDHGMMFGDKAWLLNMHPPDYKVRVSDGIYAYYRYN